MAAPARGGSTVSKPVLIQCVGQGPSTTDIDGNVIWYLRSPEMLTRVVPGGRLLVLSEGANSANDIKRSQIVREMDLAGNIIHETNISRVAEQLESRGIHSDCKKDAKECVSGFHHEAIR